MSVTGWTDAAGQPVTLTVEFGPAVSTADGGIWDVSLWDTGVWGTGSTWVDITADVRLLRTHRGRQRETGRVEAGTAELVLDNRSGDYSPENTAGPYTAGGITGIRPWRPFRIRATWAGVTYGVIAGYAISWQEQYDGPADTDSVMVVRLVDELARIAGYDAPEVAAVGAGEDAAFRIARILTNAGNTAPSALYVDFDASTMIDTVHGDNALAEIHLTCDSDAGIFYADRDGTLTYEGKFFRFWTSTSSLPTAWLTDVPGPSNSYTDIGMSYDGDNLVNIATFAKVSGADQTFADSESRALYGDRRVTRNDLICETDTMALGLATWEVLRKSTPESRIDYVALAPMGSAYGLFNTCLSAEISRRIQVTHTPVGGYTIVRDLFVEGIEHTVTADDWRTVFRCGSTAAHDLMGDPLWDAGEWDEARWMF